MYPRTLLALSLTLLAGLTSCDKESFKPTFPTIIKATELVMDKSWKVTAITVKKDTLPAEDIYSAKPTCFQDNLYTFQPNGAFLLDEGPTRCDQAASQTRTGTWAASNGGTTLTATVALAPQPGVDTNIKVGGTIESLSTTRLVLASTDTTAKRITVTRTTLIAQ
ncbi:lipocalin family protein [Hymenobacter crusticola]|uniref:Lipocalin-like domain-containing protein n=1 Tax=Hymenobacter crusticola TaxID=1770526 RepID=A0A243W7P1_9BACT|nr:lipocalin family protein [Hymenobacter crusticola]OUJ68401.1 hypothetical protein BXP70_28000 [Hymenobacter crusticola]